MPATGDTGRAADARSAIISAAESLFAAQGIEGVSLREIMRVAGQRNTTALQYHFGDRDGVIKALVEKHMQSVALRREALLDLIESRPNVELRDAAIAFVAPLIDKLFDPDGGRNFLQIAAQLVNRADHRIDPDEPVGLLVYDGGGSLDRWSDFVKPLMPAGTTGSPLHRRYAAVRFTYIEIGRRAPSLHDDHVALFASQLTDLVTSILGSAVSPETKRLMRARHR
jgi:AcrR family transcriptional regulator